MNSKWINNTSKEVLDKLDSLSESFLGFKTELLVKPDKVNDLEILSLADLCWSDHFVIAKFEVKSIRTGKIYFEEFVSRRGGRFHSLRGIVLLEKNGKITHFVVRKCQRFGLGQEIYESIGNIYQPIEELRKDKIVLSSYIEAELAKCLHVPKIRVDRFFDLGNVVTDTSMFNNIVRIFAVTATIESLMDFSVYFEGKVFDDKDYSFQIEIISVEKFYEFFGQVADSFLLAIFGRLQALNVIKL